MWIAPLVEYMSDEMYCEEHNLQSPAYEDTPDPHCPYCREEQKREAQLMHEATRDPMVEPY
jgi:hypothetical protein